MRKEHPVFIWTEFYPSIFQKPLIRLESVAHVRNRNYFNNLLNNSVTIWSGWIKEIRLGSTLINFFIARSQIIFYCVMYELFKDTAKDCIFMIFENFAFILDLALRTHPTNLLLNKEQNVYKWNAWVMWEFKHLQSVRN